MPAELLDRPLAISLRFSRRCYSQHWSRSVENTSLLPCSQRLSIA